MPSGRLSNWIICEPQAETKLSRKTKEALARLEGGPSRSRAASKSVGSLKSQAADKRQKRQFATTYSESFQNFGPEWYQKMSKDRSSPVPRVMGAEELRQEQRKADREAEYWATIIKAPSQEQNKDGTYMQKYFGPLQGSLRELALTLTGEGEIKGSFVGGPAPNTWKSEARANFTQNAFSKTSAAKYELPAKLVALAKLKNS
eukprot:g12936.t1